MIIRWIRQLLCDHEWIRYGISSTDQYKCFRCEKIAILRSNDNLPGGMA